jgi:hypothetical protein
MAFTVSKRTIWISLAILVIVVIITLVVIRAKSTYAYPDAAANAKITSIVSSAASPAGYTGVVTITTTGAHGYVAGDVLNYGTAAYVVLATPAPTITPTHTFSISTTSAAATFTANSTFKPAYKTLGDALESCNITNNNGGYTPTQFDTCIQEAATQYYNSLCPWTSPTAPEPQSGTPQYTAKQTRDNEISSGANGVTNSIGKSYIGVKNSASPTMMTVVNAARKADVTGATRKYLNTVCPNYYTTATGTVPTGYSTWGIYSSSGAATTAGASAYYFNPTLVKFSNKTNKDEAQVRFREWAKYAALDPTQPPASATSLISGCTLFSAMSADGVTPNYKLAQQYGPGTVTTAVTLPWNSTVTTCNDLLTAYVLN